jgi:hypothetical protein
MTQAFVYPGSDLFCPRVVFMIITLANSGQLFVVQTPLATSTTLALCRYVILYLFPLLHPHLHISISDAALVCCQSCPGLPSVNDGHSYLSTDNHPQLFYLPLFAHAPCLCIPTLTAAQSRKKGIDLACIRKNLFLFLNDQRSATWLVYPIG